MDWGLTLDPRDRPRGGGPLNSRVGGWNDGSRRVGEWGWGHFAEAALRTEAGIRP